MLTNEDESFIILGSSPTASLEAKINGVLDNKPLEKADIDTAMKEMSTQASMAFKAQFQLGDSPSPGSLMVASNIVTEDLNLVDLQKKFGELLDENIVLKETLKHNNESMKEQFMVIATCQEDMLKTHKMHKEKFDETRALVEKLRYENKKLKLDITRLIDGEASTVNGLMSQDKMVSSVDKSQSGNKSTGSSTIEFVTSPDDDMINKLTAQLELVEKQRRQVIVDNDKLTWQKESLENIVDATARERDELREKIKSIELKFSEKETALNNTISQLKETVQQLENKLKTSSSVSTISSEEIKKRDVIIQQYETKVTNLQSDLKKSQLKILELENVKIELSKLKSGVNEASKIYKDQIQELQTRLKDAQTVVFQPVRFSISEDKDSTSSELSSLMANVKLYDQTLKHVSELLNAVTGQTTDNMVSVLNIISSLNDVKLDRVSVDKVKAGMEQVKEQLTAQHKSSINYVAQIKGTLSIFDNIFKDYKEMLKKNITKQEPIPQKPSQSNDTLTAALLARSEELQVARNEISALRQSIAMMRADDVDKDLLKAQVDIYKNDFEAERKARETMACEKDILDVELRSAQKRLQELNAQLQEVRKLNPNIYKSATTTRVKPKTFAEKQATAKVKPPETAASASTTGTTGNMIYTCPKCNSFSSDQYKVMEDHFEYCFDDF